MTNPHPTPTSPNLFLGTELSPSAPAAPRSADSILMEEIRLLHERGLSDDCIHSLLSGFNIDARPEPAGQLWNLPSNDQLIRLIWGRSMPTPIHLD